MDGGLALQLLRHARRSRTQSKLAEEVGVGEATISRWLAAKSPPRTGLEKLIDWALKQPPLPETPDVLANAVEKTGENLVRLSEIYGVAKSALRMMHAVAAEQQLVVDTLEPWVNHEAAAINALPPEVLAAAQRAVEATQRAGKKSPSRRASGDR